MSEPTGIAEATPPPCVIVQYIPHGWLVRHHACGALAAVWDYDGDGQNLMVECDCGVDGLELAIDLGVPLAKLHPCELGHVHRYQRLTEWPDNG